MAKVILICGRICSGESTYAGRLRAERKAVLLSIDEIMLALFGLYAGERHDEYTGKTEVYLLNKAAELIESGIDVILDWGFWQRKKRKAVRSFFAGRGIACEFHYLDIEDAVWRERLERRNQAVAAGEVCAYPVDENLAAKFEALFEPPDKAEIDVWVDEKRAPANTTY